MQWIWPYLIHQFDVRCSKRAATLREKKELCWIFLEIFCLYQMLFTLPYMNVPCTCSCALTCARIYSLSKFTWCKTHWCRMLKKRTDSKRCNGDQVQVQVQESLGANAVEGMYFMFSRKSIKHRTLYDNSNTTAKFITSACVRLSHGANVSAIANREREKETHREKIPARSFEWCVPSSHWTLCSALLFMLHFISK